MRLKNKLEHYTESEYLAVIERLFKGKFRSERQHDAYVDNIVATSEHPSGSDILYYPEKDVEDSPAGVLNTIKQWREKNGKPGFKPEN
ncbi:bacteriocin immunity protein [Pseudomonas sp. Eth.TT006]